MLHIKGSDTSGYPRSGLLRHENHDSTDTLVEIALESELKHKTLFSYYIYAHIYFLNISAMISACLTPSIVSLARFTESLSRLLVKQSAIFPSEATLASLSTPSVTNSLSLNTRVSICLLFWPNGVPFVAVQIQAASQVVLVESSRPSLTSADFFEQSSYYYDLAATDACTVPLAFKGRDRDYLDLST